MSTLRVGFIHPDLGIGGAERLVVDTALGLQNRGHTVDIYTSHHDPAHCFEETNNGLLHVAVVPPWFPRSLGGRFHILFAHARQLQLTFWLIFYSFFLSSQPYDVFFVDQLSTCIPLLRFFTRTRVVFYCHFPDKLLSQGQYAVNKKSSSWLKRLYRFPMDWLEEITTGQADLILANSNFTRAVFQQNFPSIKTVPRVVYPGINVEAYEQPESDVDADVEMISSSRLTLISLNRFERKKNAALALRTFARLQLPSDRVLDLRLVLGGGYDPRVEDNVVTLEHLVSLCREQQLTYDIVTPSSSKVSIPERLKAGPSVTDPSVLFILNYSTPQRSYLLRSPNTLALLYTPQNEHFGIGPVEAMICGLPVIAWQSGGPVESVLDGREGKEKQTGWLIPSDAPENTWAQVLQDEVLCLDTSKRRELGSRAKERAKKMFAMENTSKAVEQVLIDAVNMGQMQPQSNWMVLFVEVSIGLFIGLWMSRYL